VAEYLRVFHHVGFFYVRSSTTVMGAAGWIALGLSTGLIASKLVNKRGEVREATADVEPATRTVVGVFTTGAAAQVYMLAHAVPVENWSGRIWGGHS
jgi:hypothetical protein